MIRNRVARKKLTAMTTLISLLSCAGILQSQPTMPPRAGIDAGNQAWIDGMKSGDIAKISATYAEEAVDCDSGGDCRKGRLEIERHMRAQLTASGRARSATVKSLGLSQNGGFVYEWGRAEAEFISGKKLAENYLTVWRRQADGSWKIFRNLVIPDN